MGILNNTFNKKDKKMDTKASIILSMPMFKGDSGYSLEKVIEDLKSYWGLTVDQIEGDDTTASFKIGEECVVIALMPAPIPAEGFESMYSYSYLWKDAEKEVKIPEIKLSEEERARYENSFYQQNPFRQWQSRYGGEVKIESAAVMDEGNKDKNEVALRIYKGESKAHEER